MDSFYCLVRIILNKELSLYCFSLHSKLNINRQNRITAYPVCFTAKSADKILYLFSLHSLSSVFSIQHTGYVSIELYKAELTLALNQSYIQN